MKLFKIIICLLAAQGLLAQPSAEYARIARAEMEKALNAVPSANVGIATKPGYRFAVSARSVVPTIVLAEKMADAEYLPNADERASLFIVYGAGKMIESNPQSALLKHQTRPGIFVLAENTNVTWNPQSKDFGAFSDGIVKNLNWITVQVMVKYLTDKYVDEVAPPVKPTPVVTPPAASVDVVADFTKFINDLAVDVNEYFSQRYIHSPDYQTSKNVDGKYIIVPRPNHALAHGMRTGFYAIDIAEAFADADVSQFKSNTAKYHANLVKEYIKKDANFLKKLAAAAVFQRSGRQSEIDGKESPASAIRYTEYLVKDAELFLKWAQENRDLFDNEEEITAFTKAVYDAPPSIKLSKEMDTLKYLVHQIIWASHMLDLKRLANENAFNPNTNYNPNGIKLSGASNIFGADAIVKPDPANWKTYSVAQGFDGELAFINKIWDRVERYLEATGDRPARSSTNKRAQYEDEFYRQAASPKRMVDSLIKAKLDMDK